MKLSLNFFFKDIHYFFITKNQNYIIQVFSSTKARKSLSARDLGSAQISVVQKFVGIRLPTSPAQRKLFVLFARVTLQRMGHSRGFSYIYFCVTNH